MNIQYKKICSDLLKGLPQRTTDIIERRFGLKAPERETLQEIGDSYKLTRERVRQIEEEGLAKCRQKLQKYGDVFEYFSQTLKSFGDVKKEALLLEFLGGGKFQNHVYFLLTLNNDFKKIQEDENFYSFWAKTKEAVENAKKTVELTLNKFRSEKMLLPVEKVFNIQKEEIERALGKKINKDIFASYLELSKNIQKNCEGQIGLRSWLEINPRGIKDKAYLVLKKETKPLHFRQVASYIDNLFSTPDKKAHPATVHNELIKDERFVLVGRGMYALKEWGYIPGMVKDVILKVLKDAQKPLTKEEIAKKVIEQRLVKQNTVFLNLQDRELFEKDENGKYKIREV
jgi:DNA-directed RNA polymerase delta subunit